MCRRAEAMSERRLAAVRVSVAADEEPSLPSSCALSPTCCSPGSADRRRAPAAVCPGGASRTRARIGACRALVGPSRVPPRPRRRTRRSAGAGARCAGAGSSRDARTATRRRVEDPADARQPLARHFALEAHSCLSEAAAAMAPATNFVSFRSVFGRLLGIAPKEHVVDVIGVRLNVALVALEHLRDEGAGLLRRVLEENVVLARQPQLPPDSLSHLRSVLRWMPSNSAAFV